ncbi:ROK family protein [Saccharibacillus sp. CPCC 101409]|uniref:ROK family protein n=1 Tax=Saccharibacillus sp. CPCC 101409 TaxID=3058041 RepID=UPI0026738807|nr:ROK family protein [Saccharibacillus sp. CPCC 101409]MDO3409107.1 ROK family protein [Saccharibacillus sp. CPCC 101409]
MITRTRPSIKKEVYRRILRLGTVSKADLMQDFSITSSSMTRLLDDMTAQNMIRISGLGNSTGGRKPILFQTNPTYRYLFGLEISRIYSTLGLYDMHLNPLESKRWKMDAQMTPAKLVEAVGEEAEKWLAGRELTPGDILGAGVGAVGPLDRANGIIKRGEFFQAEGWNNVPIRELLEQRLKVPVRIDNGSNTALLGEHWAMRESEIRHLLYVHAGVGIRAAMMSDGRLIRGAVDPEDAVGQMIVDIGGPRLEERGNYGAWEAFVSVRALENRVRAQLKLGRGGLLKDRDPEDLRFSDLADALNAGDTFMREQFTETAAYLGIGLANLINILHPECIVLGGPLVEAAPLVYETAVDIAIKNLPGTSEYTPVFSKTKLQGNAVAAGGAFMLMNELEF